MKQVYGAILREEKKISFRIISVSQSSLIVFDKQTTGAAPQNKPLAKQKRSKIEFPLLVVTCTLQEREYNH